MNADTHIRWMIRRDFSAVLEIENLSFPDPWDEDQFLLSMRQRNCIGMVAERDDEIVGFMVYELYKHRLQLLNIAVHPNYRHQGVGRAMVGRLVGKLSCERRNRIMLEVRETNMDALMFFKSLGFRAIAVLRDFYDDSDEDAITMQYRHIPSVAELAMSSGRMGSK